MIHEIIVAVIADTADEAHEAVVQLAQSRYATVLEVRELPLLPANGDRIDGVLVEGRLSPGLSVLGSPAAVTNVTATE